MTDMQTEVYAAQRKHRRKERATVRRAGMQLLLMDLQNRAYRVGGIKLFSIVYSMLFLAAEHIPCSKLPQIREGIYKEFRGLKEVKGG